MDDQRSKKISEIQKILSTVDIKNYPWRYLEDPYKILISEFMLHRTRADQVAPVFEVFIKTHPTIISFFEDKRESIKEQLDSLGLFWRIRKMIGAINELYDSYSNVPADYEALIRIDGIGPYIAGAVVCFSKNQPVALIDTNTVRVVGRVFGLDLEGEPRRRKEVRETIEDVTPNENPREFYYAMIDLAHELCHINNPDCEICPLKTICTYNIPNTK